MMYKKFRKGRRQHAGKWSSIDRISKSKVKMLIMDGWTDKKICDFFEITQKGWIQWKNRHPKTLALLKSWRAEAAEQVEKKLFERAKGFDYVEKQTEQLAWKDKKTGQTKTGAKKIKKTHKKVLADVDAAKFILTNHKPEMYKNRTDNKNQNLNGQADDARFRDSFFGLAPKEEEEEE